MKILKEFKEPTTIVITGQWVEGIKQSLMIDDDEWVIDVRNSNGDLISLTTFGGVYILTEKQFNWFITSDHYKLYCDDDFGHIENMYIVLKDYVGTIGAIGILHDGGETDKWLLNDYFNHQLEDADVILDVISEYDFDAMTIEEATEFLNSNEKNSKPTKTEAKISLEERIQILEDKVESQTKQIKLLTDSIDVNVT
jgi:hypothetical protein